MGPHAWEGWRFVFSSSLLRRCWKLTCFPPAIFLLSKVRNSLGLVLLAVLTSLPFFRAGGMTLLVGLYAAAILPASPTQTAGYFRGAKGWFTEREETIIVNRILRDDPSKSDMHNRQGELSSPLSLPRHSPVRE